MKYLQSPGSQSTKSEYCYQECPRFADAEFTSGYTNRAVYTSYYPSLNSPVAGARNLGTRSPAAHSAMEESMNGGLPPAAPISRLFRRTISATESQRE